MATIGEGIRTFRLSYMRKKLNPVYGPHTDSVISLLGNKMHPVVLREAIAGNLLNAHAYQQCHPDYKLEWGSPLDALDWTGSKNLPDWFSEPVEAYKPKHPHLDYRIIPGGTTSKRLVAFSSIPETLPVAHLNFSEGVINGRLSLFVNYLQKTLGGLAIGKLRQHYSGRALTRAEGRATDGWSNALLDHFESHALSDGIVQVAVVSGSLGAIGPVTTKPMHHQQLQLYGRLLMRRGYVLSEVKDPLGSGEKILMWIKNLERRKTGR